MKWILVITLVGSFLGNRIETISFGTQEECQNAYTAIRRLYPTTYAINGVCVASTSKEVYIVPPQESGCDNNGNCVK